MILLCSVFSLIFLTFYINSQNNNITSLTKVNNENKKQLFLNVIVFLKSVLERINSHLAEKKADLGSCSRFYFLAVS